MRYSQNILIMFCFWVFSGCGDLNKSYTLDEASFASSTLQSISEQTGIQFPPSSRGLNYVYDDNRDKSAFVARIALDENEATNVMQQLLQFSPLLGGVSDPLTNDVAWWVPFPDTVEMAKTYRYERPGIGTYVTAVLSKSTNDICLLYVLGD